jgi:antitoxin CcdA
MNRKVNISQPKDNHLSGFVMSEKANKWREQHADFIAAYNATVEEQGLPLDEWRSF